MEVLIVDDSETVRISIRRVLEENGYKTYEAGDAIEGLGVLEDMKTIKIIVSDFNMPGLSGLDFIEQARKYDHFRDVPVLICTTEVGDDLKERARNLGVRAWMQKPLSMNKVLGVIEKLLA